MSNLNTITLTDGLPVQSGTTTLRYRVVHLRETTVADERAAMRQAERVVPVNGVPRLVVSDAEFQFALTCRHIEAFECDGQRLPAAMIDVDLVGKLTPHDLGLIERGVFLLSLAAEVRYGHITEAQFAEMANGAPAAGAHAAPQPTGQAGGVGATAAQPEPGPAVLADHTRRAEPGAAALAAGGPGAPPASAAVMGQHLTGSAP